MNKILSAFALASFAAISGTAHSSENLNLDIQLLKDGQPVYESKNVVLKPDQDFHSTTYTVTKYPRNTDANSFNKLHVGYAIDLQPVVEPDGKIHLGAKLSVITKALNDLNPDQRYASDATVEEINEPNVPLKSGEMKIIGGSKSGETHDGYKLKIKATQI